MFLKKFDFNFKTSFYFVNYSRDSNYNCIKLKYFFLIIILAQNQAEAYYK